MLGNHSERKTWNGERNSSRSTIASRISASGIIENIESPKKGGEAPKFKGILRNRNEMRLQTKSSDVEERDEKEHNRTGGSGQNKDSIRVDHFIEAHCDQMAMNVPNLLGKILSSSTSYSFDDDETYKPRPSMSSFDSINQISTDIESATVVSWSPRSVRFAEEIETVRVIPRKNQNGFLNANTTTHHEDETETTTDPSVRKKWNLKLQESDSMSFDSYGTMPFYQVGVAVSFGFTILGLLSVLVYFLAKE